MGRTTRAIFEKQMITSHAAAEVEAKQAAKELVRTSAEAGKEVANKATSHLRHLVRLRPAAGEGVHAWIV